MNDHFWDHGIGQTKLGHFRKMVKRRRLEAEEQRRQRRLLEDD